MKTLSILMTAITLTFIGANSMAYVLGQEARLVSTVEENGLIIKTYMQETYADQYEYCSQIIVIKYDKKTGDQISAESKETCNRIR